MAANNRKKAGVSRVLIVDDHPIVRHGLVQLISQEPDLSVCGEAGDSDGAMAALESLRPDVLVMDVSLDDANGIELTKAIRAKHPRLPILILSMHDETLYAERALRAGANGYVMKVEAAETLLKAVREVLRGGLYVGERMASQLLRGFLDSGPTARARFGIESLSDREIETFELIGRGQSTREIAGRLKRSVKTIETHRTRIKQKLRLRNAAELMQHAVSWVNGDAANGSRPAKR